MSYNSGLKDYYSKPKMSKADAAEILAQIKFLYFWHGESDILKGRREALDIAIHELRRNA